MRAPRFNYQVALKAVLERFCLNAPRIELDLIDHRFDLGMLQERFDVMRFEVRKPDRTHIAVLVEILESAPGIRVDRFSLGAELLFVRGPVDEEKVEIVHAQAFTRCIERFHGLVVAAMRASARPIPASFS